MCAFRYRAAGAPNVSRITRSVSEYTRQSWSVWTCCAARCRWQPKKNLRRRHAKLLAQPLERGTQLRDFGLQLRDGGTQCRNLADGNAFLGLVFGLGNECRCARQEMRPAGLARAGLPRQLDDERACRAARHLGEERFDRRDIGEAMQTLAVDAQFAGGLRAAQHD